MREVKGGKAYKVEPELEEDMSHGGRRYEIGWGGECNSGIS